MKRAITPTQRKGMQAIIPIRAKHIAPPSCAFCRHSRAEPDGTAWMVACTLGLTNDAGACNRFRDARQKLDSSYLRVQ